MTIDRDTILDEIRQKRANEDWLDRHRSELRRRFPNRYVAVLHGQVVGADEDFPSLLARLKREYPDTNPAVAAVDFLSKEAFVWVL